MGSVDWFNTCQLPGIPRLPKLCAAAAGEGSGTAAGAWLWSSPFPNLHFRPEHLQMADREGGVTHGD